MCCSVTYSKIGVNTHFVCLLYHPPVPLKRPTDILKTCVRLLELLTEIRTRGGMNKRQGNFQITVNVSKTLFIVPTDAHYYKIIEMLKQFKIITLAPTCFGSRRNHHQGAALFFAKATNMVYLCSSV